MDFFFWEGNKRNLCCRNRVTAKTIARRKGANKQIIAKKKNSLANMGAALSNWPTFNFDRFMHWLSGCHGLVFRS